MACSEWRSSGSEPGPDRHSGGPSVGRASGPGGLAARYEDYARAALAHYGFSDAAGLNLLGLSENATFGIVEPGAGRRAVLRIHRSGYHPPGAVHSELAWLRALRRAGLPVATPLPATDGRFLVDVAVPGGERPRHAVLFEWLPGAEPSLDELAVRFELVGELAARLQRHARTWRRPPGFRRFAWDLEACLGDRPRWGRWEDGLGVGPGERQLLGRAAAAVTRRLGRYGTGADRFGLIHADMRLANLLVDGDRVHLIDFDDCGFGWYLYDLAASLSFIEHRPDVPELCQAWLAGYRRLLPVGPEDETEIPTFVMLRRLLLVAWVGSHRHADTAHSVGAGYTAVSCDLAEAYLTRYG